MRLLLQLLGRTGRTELCWGRTPQRDWRSFAAACDYHQVAAIVYCRLQDLVGFTVPSPLLEHLRARFYRVSAYNYHLAAKLIELTSQLEQAHISVLALKGPAAAIMAYGDLALRQYEDLDLVIRAEDVWKAVD